MTTVLVTGGAGFIGTNLCKKLLEKGYAVIAVDNFITSTGSNVEGIRNKRYSFVKHDITRPISEKLTKKKIDYIFHLACPTGVPNIVTLAEEMIMTCSVGTRNVMELARKNQAIVLFTSSSEVYGDPQVFPQTEAYTGNVDPGGIRSPYEEGKRVSETIIQMYVRKYSVDAKIVRIFNTYGPHMSLHDTRVIPNFLNQALHGTSLPVQGEGMQKRTFCYVDDLVDGLIKVIKKGRKGEVYNLGSDKEITIAELAKKIIDLTGSASKIEKVSRPSHDHKRRKPDLQKVGRLGWKQNIGLEEGLQKTIKWYKTAA